MKTISTLILLLLGLAAGFAQGTLTVGNSFTGFRSPIYGPQAGDPAASLSGNGSLSTPTGSTAYTGPLLQGTGFTFAVFYGQSTVSDPNALTFLVSTTFRTATANVLPAGLITTLVDIPVPGITAGNQAALQVRVWDNQGGTITSFAFADTKQSSPIFLSAPLGGVGTGGPVLTPNMTGWQSFSLTLIPEPGTCAFLGFGCAMLLAVRRRKFLWRSEGLTRVE